MREPLFILTTPTTVSSITTKYDDDGDDVLDRILFRDARKVARSLRPRIAALCNPGGIDIVDALHPPASNPSVITANSADTTVRVRPLYTHTARKASITDDETATKPICASIAWSVA